MIGPVSSSGRFPPEQYGALDTNLTVGESATDVVEFYSYSTQLLSVSGTLPEGVYFDSGTDPFNSDYQYVGLLGKPLRTGTDTFSISTTNDIGTTSVSTTLTTAAGGTVSISNANFQYTVYQSTRLIYAIASSRTITVSGTGKVYFLLIAGGGGGAGDGNGAGGGGAGEVIYGETILTPGNYAVTIGAGGAGGAGPSSNGGNGGNSTFAGFTARGGGYGGRLGTTGGLVSSGKNAGGAGGFGSRRTGAAADGGAGGFYNGGGGGSSRTDMEFGTQPYEYPPTASRHSIINDGSNGNANPNETGGNGGAPIVFYSIAASSSAYYLAGGGGGGGGNNGSVSYSGSASHSGGRGAGNQYNGGVGGAGTYYGQGGGGGYASGGAGYQGILLIWTS